MDDQQRRIGGADGDSSARRWRGCDAGEEKRLQRRRRRVAAMATAASAWQRGERRGGAMSDRSLLDEGCDSTNFDDAMEVRCTSPNFSCDLHDLSNLNGINGHQGLMML
ncbi:hypothetical protein Scep_028467 [Stephania cephalantha]|uniref:Uncharacterized protein n=1 Tax=Stephania cephalantha TaxID=152367 RepID=A0AAP0HNG8_9MAGN